jgi:hypothetical protein
MELNRPPKIGEKVVAIGHKGTFIVTNVSPDGFLVNLKLVGTEFELFNIPSSTLDYMDKE